MESRRFGHYEILEELGRGGMGTVFKARDSRLGRLVALKLISASSATPSLFARFEQEARAASALNHPNIAHIYEIGEHEGDRFIAMEYVPGRTLDRFIPPGGMNLEDAVRYACQLAAALSRAHQAGIVHRDIKPGNVIVSDDGPAKLLDFGLAKVIPVPGHDSDEAATLVQTVEGSLIGTAPYMSPEQVQGKPCGPQSDVFSFGVVLYEMLSGKRPFPGNTHMEVAASILKDTPPPIQRPLPPELSSVLTRCLEKDPARRFPSMSEVSAVLSQAPATAPARPRRWWLVAAAVVAAGAAGAFLPGLFRRQAPPSTARPVPLTAYAGNEIYSSFSPDGTQVAFSWSGERQDNADIYIKTLESPAPLRLTTDPAMDFSPAWAPDGRSIAFLRSAGQANASIMLIPATGGPARKLADITLATDISVFRDANSAVSASAVVSDLPASSLSWSPDSQWLAFGVKESRETPATLQLISVSSGERRKLTNPAHTLAGDSDPAFAPGGRAIAFARNASLGYGDIYVLPLDAQLRPRGEPARITNDNKRMAGMAWMGRNEILYSAGDSLHEFRLWRVAVDASAKPQLWSAVLTDSCYPSISADGRKLAFTTRSLDSNIWEVERLAGGKTRARRLVASTRIDFNGRYSPDGKRIAFASNRSGEMEMWVANTEDGAQRQITELRGGNAGSPRWSPDANWLVFDWLKQGIWGVYKVSVNGGQPVLMTSRPGGDNNPVFSADGRWVYFASERSGNSQVWKVPSQGGEPVMVTHGGGQASAESPDGAWLYFARSYDLATQLWRMPSSGGEETQVLPSIFRRAFAISNDGIYFIPAPGGDGITSIRFHPFKGPEVEIHEIQSPVSWGLSLSPDARKLLYTQYDQTGSDLVLVEGFR